MKLRHLILGIAILAGAATVAGVGAYLKYDVLKPLGLYQEMSIFELPFLMHSDEALKFMVEHADELLTEPDDTEPTWTEPEGTDPTHSIPPVSQLPNTQTQPTETRPQTTQTTSPSNSTPTTVPTPPVTTIPPQTTKPTPPATTKPTEPPTTTEPTEPDIPSGYPDFYFPEGVDESWFDDVLFIGDSRTVGLKNYARSGNADYFCDVGSTVFNITTKQLSDKNFSSQTLESLLSSKKYGKVFINLGLNECGYPLKSVKLKYDALVALVREKQPNAIIIVQGVMAVTQKKASQGSYFEPAHLAKLNNNIKANANEEDIFYIDCNVYFTDSNGYLYTSLTNDGYHPTGTGYSIWRSWIHWVVGQLDI